MIGTIVVANELLPRYVDAVPFFLPYAKIIRVSILHDLIWWREFVLCHRGPTSELYFPYRLTSCRRRTFFLPYSQRDHTTTMSWYIWYDYDDFRSRISILTIVVVVPTSELHNPFPDWNRLTSCQGLTFFFPRKSYEFSTSWYIRYDDGGCSKISISAVATVPALISIVRFYLPYSRRDQMWYDGQS